MKNWSFPRKLLPTIPIYMSTWIFLSTPLLSCIPRPVTLIFQHVQPFTLPGKKQILRGLQVVSNLYYSCGFNIIYFHGNNKFDLKLLYTTLQPIDFNICAKDEHVPIIERDIHTVKERCPYTTHSLPYVSFPKIMTCSLVTGRVAWLNQFPTKTGVSSTLSAAALVLGTPKPDLIMPWICFGPYALAHTLTKNNMTPRAVLSIALQESNRRGGFILCPSIWVSVST